MADQSLTIVGTLVRDPELRFTQGGSAVASFGVAINSRRKVRDEWVEKTTFLDCTAWGSLAENVSASCRKGTRVICVGELEQREYETQGGEKRKVLELKLDECGPALRFATTLVEKNPRKDDR